MPKPFWQQIERTIADAEKVLDDKIREAERIAAGLNEPTSYGLWAQDELDEAEEEYRVIVPRRLAKPLAE